MRPTYHLVPVEVWAAADDAEPYAAASLATEGFIHCTDGVAPLGVTFDRLLRCRRAAVPGVDARS